MNDLDDRLRALQDLDVSGAPPVAELRRRARRRQTRRVAAGSAAALVVVGGLSMVLSDDDDRTGVTTEESTTVTTDAPATTSTTSPPETSAVSLDDVVIASEHGVQVGSTGPLLSSEPAAIAYAIGDEYVVFQGAGGEEGTATGVLGYLRVWRNGEVMSLPTDPPSRARWLLDAAMVDGVPTALVAESFGGVGPDDTFEELVQIDLRDLSRDVILRRSSWESGTFQGRLLENGDVVGLVSSEAYLILVQTSRATGETMWSVEVGLDTNRELALQGGITLIEQHRYEERGYELSLFVTPYDGGVAGETVEVAVDDPKSSLRAAVRCTDWTSANELICSQGGGPPVLISTEGSWRPIESPDGAVLTVVRQP